MKFPPSNRIDDLISYMKSELLSLYEDREAANLSFLVAEEVLGFGKAQLMVRADERIHQSELLRCMQILEKLKNGVPFQYIAGYTFFRGLKIFVSTGVLIPRPETEELVDRVMRECEQQNPRILDVGTGSGCIAIALKMEKPQAAVFASDSSEICISVAKANAEENGADVCFFKADILQGEPKVGDLWDVIVSNPPYIPRSERERMHINVKEHEPQEALFVPDTEPLLFYDALARYAERYLAKNGLLFLEIHESFGVATTNALRKYGFGNVSVYRDINGKDRMICAARD